MGRELVNKSKFPLSGDWGYIFLRSVRILLSIVCSIVGEKGMGGKFSFFGRKVIYIWKRGGKTLGVEKVEAISIAATKN